MTEFTSDFSLFFSGLGPDEIEVVSGGAQLICDIDYVLYGNRCLVRRDIDPAVIQFRRVVIPLGQKEKFWQSEAGRRIMTRQQRADAGRLYESEKP